MLPPAADATLTRPRCPRCRRPLATCLCHWVRPTPNTVPVWVLQHPLERDQAKGSLPLLRLSLARCRCEPPGEEPSATLAALADPPDRRAGRAPPPAVLLYPADAGPAAIGLPLPLPDPAATRLVVLDGTWRKTRRLLHEHPALAALPRWPLPAPPAARYAPIRRAPRPGQLSTLEAVCHALAALEGAPERYAPLLAAFEGWVAEEAGRAAAAPRAQAGSRRTG